MKNNEVRILSVELTNFKNVENGIIVMPSALDKDYFSNKADLVGIYGQNGSGKTSVIEALQFIKDIFSENKIENYDHYINKRFKELKISVKFSLFIANIKAVIGYSVVYGSNGLNNSNQILSEVLTFSNFENNHLGSKITLINYNVKNKLEALISPKKRLNEILNISSENKINLEVARQLSIDNKTSFIFSKRFLNLFGTASKFNETKLVLLVLNKYAITNFFVVTNKNNGLICSQLFLPVSFRLEEVNNIKSGVFPISLTGSNKIEKDKYELIQKIIEKINIVLIKIIPGLQIEIHEFEETLDKDNNVKKRFELVSNREGVEIPFKYESDGIIKIISILNLVICVYNNSGMFLAIDELDSGIFEYLLGQFISVFQKGAKGQMLFTSHNLRVLELAEKKSIVFSTVNPKNRFIRFSNIKSNNNLRDVYLRSIVLEGQKEKIYEETDDVEISRALRKIKKD